MTFYSSVFTSPSRIKLALIYGLDCNAMRYQCAAGKYANIATLATAHELGMKHSPATILCAAQRNKLAEVQYLRSQGYPWALCQLEEAARSGSIEVMRWCREQGCPWNAPFISHYAAESGNVELMAWVLQQPGTQLSEAVMSRAVGKGHAAMCYYMREQQCPWDANSTTAAASRGHVDLLRWLMENGCPWDADDLCEGAAGSNSAEVLTYLQQQGLLNSTARLTVMLNHAGHYNKLAAAQWLRDRDAQWPTQFVAWRPWSDDLVAWARAEGCTTQYEPLEQVCSLCTCSTDIAKTQFARCICGNSACLMRALLAHLACMYHVKAVL
jgi:hypothetical protein